MAKLLASSLVRTHFNGEVVIFRNTGEPIFQLDRLGITECEVNAEDVLNGAEATELGWSAKYRVRKTVQRMIGEQGFEKIFFIDCDCLALRNIDHLLDGDDWDIRYFAEPGRPIQDRVFNCFLTDEEMGLGRRAPVDGDGRPPVIAGNCVGPIDCGAGGIVDRETEGRAVEGFTEQHDAPISAPSASFWSQSGDNEAPRAAGRRDAYPPFRKASPLRRDGINSGTLAVRAECYSAVMGEWERIERGPAPQKKQFAEQAAWNRLVLDSNGRKYPWRVQLFERDGIQLPLQMHSRWQDYMEASLVHCLGVPTHEKLKFMFGLWMSQFYWDDRAAFFNLLEM